MKTNAKPATIKAAVEKVSREKYDGNIIFRNPPQKLTKNVNRFTLKAKDKNKAGALNTNGLKQPKVDQSVYLDVMQEVFRLEPQSHIYGDHSVIGRLYNDTPQDVTTFQPEIEETSERALLAENTTSKVSKKAQKEKEQPKGNKNLNLTSEKVLNALQLILDHPELIESLQKKHAARVR